MRRAFGIGLVAVLLLGGMAVGFYWWRVARFIETTDDAFVQADISAISPKIQGYVREVRVGDNQPRPATYWSSSTIANSKPRSTKRAPRLKRNRRRQRCWRRAAPGSRR
jgi:hypothetical protein